MRGWPRLKMESTHCPKFIHKSKPVTSIQQNKIEIWKRYHIQWIFSDLLSKLICMHMMELLYKPKKLKACCWAYNNKEISGITQTLIHMMRDMQYLNSMCGEAMEISVFMNNNDTSLEIFNKQAQRNTNFSKIYWLLTLLLDKSDVDRFKWSSHGAVKIQDHLADLARYSC